MRAILVVALAFEFPPTASGQERPILGTVYNTRENHSLDYDCRLDTSTDRLHCRFVQTTVRKAAEPDELQEKLAQARKAYPNIVKQIDRDKGCLKIPMMIDALRGNVSAEDFFKATNNKVPSAEEVQRFKKAQQDVQEAPEVIGSLVAMAQFCKTGTEADFLAMTERQFEIDSRTCHVSSYSFEQEFKPVGSDAWVADQGAQGECGVVELSRFESEKSGNATFWNYVSRKAVTLPQTETALGKCGEMLDENEYRYSWVSQGNLQLGCEWITFSRF